MTKKFFRKYIVPLLFTFKIPTVSRISLDFELVRQFKRLKPGIVLEAGSGCSSYKKYIPYTEYLTLDINKESKPDICCDLHNIKWNSDYFDIVITTCVLEHVHTPEKVISEIWKILKPGGSCILAVPFIYPYHPGPKDYYRFTRDSLSYLFREFNKVEIYHYGNKIQAIWELINKGKINIILNIFNPLIARIHFQKTTCPCGFVVYAKK